MKHLNETLVSVNQSPSVTAHQIVLDTLRELPRTQIEKILPCVKTNHPVTHWLDYLYDRNVEFNILSREVDFTGFEGKYNLQIPDNLLEDVNNMYGEHHLFNLVSGYGIFEKNNFLSNDIVDVLKSVQTDTIGAIPNFQNYIEDTSISTMILIRKAMAMFQNDPRVNTGRYAVCGPDALLYNVLQLDIQESFDSYNLKMDFHLDDRFDKIYIFPLGVDGKLIRSALAVFEMDPIITYKDDGYTTNFFFVNRQKIVVNPINDKLNLFKSIDI